MSAHTDPADARTVGSAIISALGVDADSRAWTFTARSPVPLQDGFLDCGVFVLVFALYALISRQLPSDIDPRLWRRLFKRALGDVLPDETSWLPVLPQNAQPSTLDDFVEWHKKLQVTAHAMTKLRNHAHEMAAVIALVDTQADLHLQKARATRAASEQGVLARKKALELLQTVDQLCADDAAIKASLQRRIDESAMRLRQLGITQSVVFFATPEVHQSILDHNKKENKGHIDSHDVVNWLLEQTCRGIEQLQSLYLSQGLDFCSEAAAKFPNYLMDSQDRAAYLKEIRCVENQTLEGMYQPRQQLGIARILEQPSLATAGFLTELAGYNHTLEMVAECTTSHLALQEVEQEREVAYEVEAIRKV
ncbi:hypothetical protein SLS56_011484 [Neofusicoccum ribis]|uniref:ubiquitinyl hydrolase 1 n=1 Tax=Neofusicoccum ribis TaxID=45134 RepID=A0ABR3SCX6_9PEZI